MGVILAGIDICVFRINQNDRPLLATDVVDERHFGLHRHNIAGGPVSRDDLGAVDFTGEKFRRRGIFFYRGFGKVPQAIDIAPADGDGGKACLQIVVHVFHRELAVRGGRGVVENDHDPRRHNLRR